MLLKTKNDETIAYRYWVKSNAYFKTQYNINLSILNGLKSANIIIPFPQREIRMLKDL